MGGGSAKSFLKLKGQICLQAKKKKRPSLESKDILTTKPVSVMLIFTDASQVSRKTCLTKAQRTQSKTESG